MAPLIFFKNREVLSLYLGFASLAIYTIRIRPGSFYLLAVENLLFIGAIFFYPWNKSETLRICKYLAIICIYSAITFFIYYPTNEDLKIAIISSLLLIKCGIFFYYIYKFSPQLLYAPLKIVYCLCLCAQILALIISDFKIDLNSGFNGFFGDRNYMSIMNVIFLYSILSIKKLLQKKSMKEELIAYILTVITIITIGLSYSRSGLLSLVLVLMIFYHKNIFLWGLIILAYCYGIFDQVIGRFHFSYNTNELARINQYLVFIEIFRKETLNLIFGFGPMASEHLNWLSSYYKKIGVSEGVTVIHNTFFEIVLSFGVCGVLILIKAIKKLTWQSIALVVTLGAFNNLLIFLPFYLLIGVSMILSSGPRPFHLANAQ